MADDRSKQEEISCCHNQNTAAKNNRAWNWPAIWSGVSAITPLAILVTTVMYASFSYYQWQAMLESNRINKSALVEIQRASVLYNGLTYTLFKNGLNVLGNPSDNVGGPAIGISPQWTNAGGTSTKNLRIFFGEPIESVTRIERPDMRIPPDTQWMPVVIGPKASQNGMVRPIAIEKIKQIKDGKLHIYLWGDAYYNDIFAGTVEHVTKFCQEIGGVYWSTEPPDNEFTITNLVLVPCMIHNCIDADCEGRP